MFDSRGVMVNVAGVVLVLFLCGHTLIAVAAPVDPNEPPQAPVGDRAPKEGRAIASRVARSDEADLRISCKTVFTSSSSQTPLDVDSSPSTTPPPALLRADSSPGNIEALRERIQQLEAYLDEEDQTPVRGLETNTDSKK